MNALNSQTNLPVNKWKIWKQNKNGKSSVRDKSPDQKNNIVCGIKRTKMSTKQYCLPSSSLRTTLSRSEQLHNRNRWTDGQSSQDRSENTYKERAQERERDKRMG